MKFRRETAAVGFSLLEMRRYPVILPSCDWLFCLPLRRGAQIGLRLQRSHNIYLAGTKS
jgi:hypothetical protein